MRQAHIDQQLYKHMTKPLRHTKKQPLTLKANDVASAVLAHMRAHIYT
jgi:hypothetical protein